MRAPRIFDAFRPAHEAWAAGCWATVALHAAVLPHWLGVDPRWSACLCAIASALAAWRLAQARALWRFKLRLAGAGSAPLSAARLDQVGAALDGQVWLGWGFRWQPLHAQLCHDILQRSLREIYPPSWALRLLGLPPHPALGRGLAWVHGLDRERDIVLPMAALEGHTAVLAVTGALKTVLARLLVYQLARRGDTVIVLDPKGDKGLEQVCRDVCVRLGDPDRFLRFHVAFPHESFRLDVLADWERETEVASRLRLLVGGDADHFADFAWMAVTDFVRAMQRVHRRVSLQSLLAVLRSADPAEALAQEVLEDFFAQRGEPAAPRSSVPPPTAPGRSPPSRFAHPHLAAAVQRFRTEVPPFDRPADIVALLALLDTDRSWFAKMVVGLTPMLTRLTAGELGPLLSPDHTDPHDPRPIFTTAQLVTGRRVVYLGLDALSDTAVAEGVASLVLSELAATAGNLYNHGPADGRVRPRVHVLCDEWGDLVCEPIIQLANKGRGAGIVLYLFGQTLADLVVKLGDEGRAKRVLGNMNNLIVGATSDADTLEFVARKLGETTVRRATVSQGAGQKAEDAGLSYAATRQASITEQTVDLVPASVLAGLPDLHYLAVVNRAQVFKGRIPVLQFDLPDAPR